MATIWRELLDVNNFNVCAVFVAIAVSTFVDVAVVVGIVGVEANGRGVVSVPNKIISGRLLGVDGTFGVRSRASIGYKVMRWKLARFNLSWFNRSWLYFNIFQ